MQTQDKGLGRSHRRPFDESLPILSLPQAFSRKFKCADGTWSGTGDISNRGSGRLTDSVGGSFDIRTDADFTGGTFINQGALTKSVGATDGSDKTVISSLFNNSGSVNVQQGTLEVTTPFNNQGTINVATGAVFHGNNASLNSFDRLTVTDDVSWAVILQCGTSAMRL